MRAAMDAHTLSNGVDEEQIIKRELRGIATAQPLDSRVFGQSSLLFGAVHLLFGCMVAGLFLSIIYRSGVCKKKNKKF
jgi:hypothetical protein